MVHTLRAGYAVESYEELDPCWLIAVLSTPEYIHQLLDELASASIDWNGKTLLLLDSSLDSQDLGIFRARHAEVASLDPIESHQGVRFVLQADPKTAKKIRGLVEDGRTRMWEIRPGTKSRYLAGLTIVSSFATPLMAASVECLIRSGLDLTQAELVVELMLAKTQRAFLKAGRRGWTGPLAARDIDAMAHQLRAMRETNPALANYFLEGAKAASQYFQQDIGWIEELAQPPHGKEQKSSSRRKEVRDA